MRMIIALLGSLLPTHAFADEDSLCFPPLVEYHDYWTGERLEVNALSGDYDIGEIREITDLEGGEDLIFYEVYLSSLSKRKGLPNIFIGEDEGLSPEGIEGLFEEQILP